MDKNKQVMQYLIDLIRWNVSFEGGTVSKLFMTCLLLLVVWMTACTASPSMSSPSATPRPTSIVSKPSDSINPTASPFLPTRTPQPTLTPTSTQEVLTQQCLQANSTLPKEVIPSGILVNYSPDGVSLINFSMQTRRDISGTIDSVGTSPDGKWLAYSTSINNKYQIVFESMVGEKSFQVLEDPSWFMPGELLWMDNQRIWFPDVGTVQPATPILVLNPFTGKKVLIQTDFPGTMHYQLGPSRIGLHFGYSSAVYDPSLNWVIYPEFEMGQGYFQTLWDRKAQKVVARILDDGGYGNLPEWQDRQKQFFVVGYPDSNAIDKEWLAVSLEGQVRPMTDFWKTGRKYRIENNASLSPDGKTLAFSMAFKKDAGDDYEPDHLILLDLETRTARDTCFLSGSTPAWSLDGRYLAMAAPGEDGGYNGVILIDTKTNQSYQVLEGNQMFPVGWLIQP